MLSVFMLVNLVTNKGVVAKETATVPVIVGGLQADTKPGAKLQYCLQSEEVPSNIDSAFVVPVNTATRPGQGTPNRGAGEFSCEQPLTTTNTSASELISFFNQRLQASGWSLFSHGASNGDPQSLFQKAGSDGFYWEVGVTVNKSTTSSVNWTFQIYQNSETV
ncbi:MAG: hypothetical protein JWM55_1253 [Acidimicrobiaceae bacterium]|nr:hypothetical protein [Acidimicrobiaceae bacterium]